MIVYPEYYTHFKCIASACKHSCCKGWEIDVDHTALKKYAHIEGEFGEKLRHSIYIDDDGAHFALDAEERCPFLQKDGLCEMILRIGEDKLCQICTDHPRFRSFLTERTEIGLGLCCEAAAKLILSWDKKFKLFNEPSENSSDSEFLHFRETILNLLTDRSLSLDERFNAVELILATPLSKISFNDWLELYAKLEVLDSSWLSVLSSAEITAYNPCALSPELELAFEQLAVYFIYRHLSGALDDDYYKERALFALHATEFIKKLFFSQKEQSFDTLLELSRLYSSEIEYSDENLYAILDKLSISLS